jgi:hypothetical protein
VGNEPKEGNFGLIIEEKNERIEDFDEDGVIEENAIQVGKCQFRRKGLLKGRE